MTLDERQRVVRDNVCRAWPNPDTCTSTVWAGEPAPNQARSPRPQTDSQRTVVWCVIGLIVCLVLASVLHAQVSVSAALTGNLASSDPTLRDREVIGIRYRTPSLAGFTAQAGTLLSAENGIVRPSDGAGIRHWAVGAEYLVTKHLRAQLEYGNFDEVRPSGTTLPPFTYYRFWAVGTELTLGQTVVVLEKTLSAPHQTHAGIHDYVIQAHGEWFDLMASTLHQSSDQAPYHFAVLEATLRPFARLPQPFRYFGIEGGTRALPSVTTDAERPVTFVAMGFFLHLGA